MKINVWQYREDRRRKELSAASTIQKWYRKTSKGNETRAWYKYAFTEAQRIIARGGDKDTVHLMRYIRNNKKKQRKKVEKVVHQYRMKAFFHNRAVRAAKIIQGVVRENILLPHRIEVFRRNHAAKIIQREVRENLCFCGMPDMPDNTTPDIPVDTTPDIPNVMECSFAGGAGMNITQTFLNVASSLLLLGSHVSLTSGLRRNAYRRSNYRRPSHLLMLLIILVNLGSASAAGSQGLSFNLHSIMAALGCLVTYETFKEMCNCRTSAAALAAIYPMKVLRKIEPILHEWYINNHPEFLSRGAPVMTPEMCDEFCEGIANAVYERDSQDNTKFVNEEVINQMYELFDRKKDKKYRRLEVIGRDSLITMMKDTSTTRQSNLGLFVSKIRAGRVSNYAQAQTNEANNLGPFQGHAEGDREEMRTRINDLVGEDDDASSSTSQAQQEDLYTEAEAHAIVRKMLQEHELQYLLDYKVPQLMAMVVADVKGCATLAEAEEYLKNHEFEDHELNAIVAKMDYIIKTKASLELVIPKLMDGTAIYLDLYDPAFKARKRDIYIMAPPKLKYEICRGAAKKLFDSYKVYENMTKSIPEGRYMVGIFTARVFDTMSQKPRQLDSYAIPLRPDRMMREISYGNKKNLNEVKIATRTGNQYTFTLHRFVAIVAGNHKLTIFTNKDKLLQLLDTDDVSYDRIFDYRSSRDVYVAIKKGLRKEASDSSECDVDHRAGRKHRYCDGLLRAAPTSHRMNICFIKIRDNESDWCWGLRKMRYEGGVESPPSTKAAILVHVETTYTGASSTPIPMCKVLDILKEHPSWVSKRDNLSCHCKKVNNIRVSYKGVPGKKCHYCRRWNRKNGSEDPADDSTDEDYSSADDSTDEDNSSDDGSETSRSSSSDDGSEPPRSSSSDDGSRTLGSEHSSRSRHTDSDDSVKKPSKKKRREVLSPRKSN